MEKPEPLVEKVTGWVGSTTSLVLHTILFAGAFVVGFFHVAAWDMVLLILTTAVSLEAIYLAIFIQMTVNQHTKSLQEVEEDLDEIQEDVDEIQEDIDDIEEDIDEIQEDVEDIQEDVEEISEGDEKDVERKKKQEVTLVTLAQQMDNLLKELEQLKKK